MPFEKGKSGNPGGRPKVIGEVQTLARQYTKEAIETLRDIMQNKKAPPAARGFAANSILDRGYGRPSQTINSGPSDKALDQMTDAELIAIITNELKMMNLSVVPVENNEEQPKMMDMRITGAAPRNHSLRTTRNDENGYLIENDAERRERIESRVVSG